MKDIRKAIEKIAKSEGANVESVREEMENAIKHAWENDESMHEMFDARPTVEQFILSVCVDLNLLQLSRDVVK